MWQNFVDEVEEIEKKAKYSVYEIIYLKRQIQNVSEKLGKL